jgi:EAL domain-containing protein (putative c-di-GMP-specific phosphodiesterase class I)
MTVLIAEKVALTGRLRKALEQDKLTLQYQPQIDMRSQRVIGVEALVRWTDPDLGPISPDLFIPIAETSGLIERLGEWVLFEACRQTMEWRRCGLQSLQIVGQFVARTTPTRRCRVPCAAGTA